MDYRPANLSCVLKLNSRCDACKRQTMEVLSSLDGVYDVTIDAETKTAKIVGQVNPTYCLKALARCGVHAELVWANLSHPRMTRGPFDHDYSTYAYNHTGEPYSRRSLPEGMWHESRPMRNALPEYSHTGYPTMRNDLPEYSYNYDEARRAPYYTPSLDYNPLYGDHESMNFCSIM